MNLEFLADIQQKKSNYQEEFDQIIRLYNFEPIEAKMLQSEIKDMVINRGQSLDLSTLNYIKPINCKLSLQLNATDRGISTIDQYHFTCCLTARTYERMIFLINDFCFNERSGHHWLYDIDTPIDFLFSPDGTW